MARTYLTNAADSELYSDVLTPDATIEILSTFDAPAVPFYLVIDPHSPASREYVKVNSLGSAETGYNVWNVTRNLTGSVGTVHFDGALVRVATMAQHFDDLWERPQPLRFVGTGAAGVIVGVMQEYSAEARTIIRCRAWAQGAPSGADLVFDVNLSGTTIFTTQANRPTVDDGDSLGAWTVPDVTTWPIDTPLTVDVDEAAGENVVLEIEWSVA